MVAFANRDADVLVCTTIIESGLDMPNVNTIIIDRADRFGLAQLYQLRGRVGAETTGPTPTCCCQTARKLPRRPASASTPSWTPMNWEPVPHRHARSGNPWRGEPFGAPTRAVRSTRLDSILYSELLNQAVQDLANRDTGETSADAQPPPRIDLQLPAFIPPGYIRAHAARLAFYQRLSNITDRSQIAAVQSDMEDRFGPVPQEVGHLLAITELALPGLDRGCRIDCHQQ